MTKKNRKYLSKNNIKNMFSDKYTENKQFKRVNTEKTNISTVKLN